MQKKILDAIYKWSLQRGKLVLIVMMLVTVIMGAFIPKMIISSSQEDLIPKDDPEQAKYLQYKKEFGSPDNLIIILEGDSDLCKEYADKFAEEIGKETRWVESIFYKIDATVLMKRAPLFVPVDSLKKAREVLKKKEGWVGKINNITSLYSMMNEVTTSFKEPHSGISVEGATNIIIFFDAFFREWDDWLSNPNQIKLQLEKKLSVAGFSELATLESGGYLFSRDFKMLFLFVQPKNYNDEITYLRPFIKDMRSACDRVYKAHPEIKDKIKVAFTGMPAHVHTEIGIIYEDVADAVVLSIIIVSLVLLIGFRSIKKTFIAVIPTVAGLVISLGIITILIGKLNLISSSFLAVLFGIGIDFGIYLLQRTEEELGNGLPMNDAIYKSVVLTSRSVISAGLTTSLAFFALSLSDFSGYSELGLAAGIGLMVVMITTFLMMPPLLFMIRIEPRDYQLRETIFEAAKLEQKKIHLVIIGISVAITVFSIFAVTQLKMDYNVLKLLPRNTESTIYQRKMEDNSDFKLSFAMITDKSLEDLQKITEKVEKLPTVSRVESLAKYIPDNQQEKIKIIRQIRPLLGNFHVGLIEDRHSTAEYVAVLEKMSEYFEEAQEKAFAGGQSDLVSKIDSLLANMDTVKEKLSEDSDGAALMRTRRFEKELFTVISKATQLIRESMDPSIIDESTFPKEIISRFKSPQGTYVAMVSPTGSIWDIGFLDKFVNDLRSVTPNITGFPVTHRVYVRQAASAIFRAMIYSFVIILVLLIMDFKGPRGVLLALLPLVIGMLWLNMVLYFAKIDYNVANIAGLPLLLGLGVVYGLRIVHRWRENTGVTAFAATKTTGRGLVFAALAIVVGLGSIVPARHNGVSAFGIILLIGIVLCLFTALVILPAVIDYLYIVKNKEAVIAEAKERKDAEAISTAIRKGEQLSKGKGSKKETKQRKTGDKKKRKSGKNT